MLKSGSRRILIPFLASFCLQTSGQEPIRISTRLIETDVVVRDSRGPVRDLNASSFKVFADGKEQRIALFRVIDKPPVIETLSPPGTFTNRSCGCGRPARYRAILIDTLNTNLQDQAFARREILKILGGPSLSDPLAIYVLGESFRVLQDFTTDEAKLRRAVENFRPEQSHTLKMATTTAPLIPGDKKAPQVNMATLAAFQEMRNFANVKREEMTLEAFEALADKLATAPGRKTLVWITSAFPPKLLRGQEERWRALNRANVAVYPVHAEGLTVAGSQVIGSLTWIADRTGGRASYNRNDIGEQVKEALLEGQEGYSLAFYAEKPRPDGMFHELKIVVLGRRDVEVRSRGGYFDKETDDSQPDLSLLLKRAASSPFDVSDIGLAAKLERTGVNLTVEVKIDFADLRLESVDGRWKGSASLVFLSQDRDGRDLDLASKELNFDMTDELYRARRIGGLTFIQTIRGPKGLAKLKVIVADQSGRVGSLSLD